MFLRGQVYEFLEKDQTKKGKYVLIVSSNERTNDKVISVIFSKNYDKPGHNIVEVKCSGENFCFNTFHVTYCSIDQIGELVGDVNPADMDKIDRKIAFGLGLTKILSAYEFVTESLKTAFCEKKEI